MQEAGMGIHRCNTFKLRQSRTPLLWILILFVGLATHSSSCKKVETVQLAGMVERKTLELSAPISEIIVEIPVTEGQRIEADQIIVQLDTEVVAAELSAQEAALAAAEAFQTEADGEFKRQENLRRARVASPKALDVARRARDEAAALVAEKIARVLQAQKRLDDLTIRSRASGVVDQLPFAVGERVPAGGVVGVVISDDKPWVRVWLPARVVARVKPQLEAKVRIQGLESWLEGNLEYVSREPEFTPHYAITERESSHLVYESRVALQNAPDDLRPGLPAQVVLNFRKSD
jgi:HlyD family secretion protein